MPVTNGMVCCGMGTVRVQYPYPVYVGLTRAQGRGMRMRGLAYKRSNTNEHRQKNLAQYAHRREWLSMPGVLQVHMQGRVEP